MANPLIPDVKYATLITEGNGTQTEWEFNFAGGYISRDHVKAFTEDKVTGQLVIRTLDFVGPNTVRIAPAVANGLRLVIYRDTPKMEPIVNYTDGSVMSETNLDKSNQQAVFIAAELADRVVADYDFSNALLYAVETATDASNVANAIDGKAQQALDNSVTAIATSVAANNTANTTASSLSTFITSLASYAGAALVGIRRAGVNAVARTLAAFVADFPLTPKDYGCVCDGVADDTVNFGRWLDACAGRWGTIPDGCLIRLTSNPLLLTTHRARIRGHSSQFRAESVTIGADRDYAGLLLDGPAATLGGSWNEATDTITYPQRLRGLCNLVVAGTNGAKCGVIEFFDSTVVSGMHFQNFTDHGVFIFGSVFSTVDSVSFSNCGLGKPATGSWLGHTFRTGCGLHFTGGAPSGQTGNYMAGRTFGSSNFSSTTNITNTFADTITTQSTSCKGMHIANVRSTSLRNVGGYSGILIEWSNVELISDHFEIYADGGEVAHDGKPQAVVIVDSTVRSGVSSGATTREPLVLRSTPESAGTDYWAYFLQVGARWQVSRLGVSELILGEKLAPGSYKTRHIASTGTNDNPCVIWDTNTNSLRVSRGGSYANLLGVPIYLSGTVPPSGAFVDLNSALLLPPVNFGSGPGGMYDIDVQIFSPADGRVFYSGSWSGMRQIPGGQYATRFYESGHVDNNPPVGGFVVSESNAGGAYNLRITNGTGFTFSYTVVSRLRAAVLPMAP